MATRNVTVDFPRSYSGTSTEADAKLYWESYQDVGHKMLPVEFSTMREGVLTADRDLRAVRGRGLGFCLGDGILAGHVVSPKKC